MIGKTLGIYIAWRFLKASLGMLVALYFLIVTVDFVEQLKKAAGLDEFDLLDLYLISLTKAPMFLEKAFPFGCLFATMVTLTQLNNKMELVVARAAGVSAWQFLLPISLVAVLLGLFVSTTYNPLSIHSLHASENLAARVFGHNQRNIGDVKGYWIKQKMPGGGSMIINARLARQAGKRLDDVKIVEFAPDKKIARRLDAKIAVYRVDKWLLIGVTQTGNDGKVENLPTLIVDSTISENALLGITAAPDRIPFWDLEQTSRLVSDSGGNPLPYKVQFQTLLALPLLLVAMVLTAAVFSLKFVRFGQVGRMILGGILSGFVLYTVTSLVTAMGSNGVVPPFAAAWSPAFVAVLFGMSVLLYQEDG